MTPSFRVVGERVLGIYESGGAAGLLTGGDDLQGQGGLARRFRAVDFDYAARWQTANAESDIESERPG